MNYRRWYYVMIAYTIVAGIVTAYNLHAVIFIGGDWRPFFVMCFFFTLFWTVWGALYLVPQSRRMMLESEEDR